MLKRSYGTRREVELTPTAVESAERRVRLALMAVELKERLVGLELMAVELRERRLGLALSAALTITTVVCALRGSPWPVPTGTGLAALGFRVVTERPRDRHRRREGASE